MRTRSMGDSHVRRPDRARAALFLALLCGGACVVDARAGGQLPAFTSLWTTPARVAGRNVVFDRGDGGNALSALLAQPYDMAITSVPAYLASASRDSVWAWGYRVLWVAEYTAHRIRAVFPNGTLTTAVGSANAVRGFEGDGGAASSALLTFPRWCAGSTSRPGLWISENLRIRYVDTHGIIRTAAGNGTTGYSGDGGPASLAMIGYVQAIATDAGGERLWFSDYNAARVRLIRADGIIVTIAGTGDMSYGGDGGAALSANMSVGMLAVSSDGATVWIADTAQYRIRRIANGTIDTVAGTGTYGELIVGSPATSSPLSYIQGMAYNDATGDVWFTDSYSYSKLMRVTANGTLEAAVVGDLLPTSAYFNGFRLFPDLGIYLVADSMDQRVVMGNLSLASAAPPPGHTHLHTVAGSTSSTGFNGDDILASTASLRNPSNILWSEVERQLIIADTGNHRVRAVNASGIISTLAGNGSYGFSGDGGPALSAMLYSPMAVAADERVGLTWIADANNYRIRVLWRNGTIQTAAGNGSYTSSGNGGPASLATLGYVRALVASMREAGVWFIDQSDHMVRYLTLGGNVVAVAGNGTYGFFGDGGPATQAMLYSPNAMTVDHETGTLWIGDNGNRRIRVVWPNGTIDTVAGTGEYATSVEQGPALHTNISLPLCMRWHAASRSLYFSEFLYPTGYLRRISPEGEVSSVWNTTLLPIGSVTSGRPLMRTFASFDMSADGTRVWFTDAFNAFVWVIQRQLQASISSSSVILFSLLV